MSWLVDADVLSQPMKSIGNPKAIAWFASEFDRCYTSTIVIGQLALWVRTREGRQRIALQKWLSGLLEEMEGRIHGFNVTVAHVWAEQQRLFDQAGVRMPIADSYIAATAKRHGLTIATGNEKDFRRPGIKIFNPFNA
jgi:predicted nucleic acid-binding protein